MKLVAERPYFDPERVTRKLLEIAGTIEPVQDGRIHIETINLPFWGRRLCRLNTVSAQPRRSRGAGNGSTRPELTGSSPRPGAYRVTVSGKVCNYSKRMRRSARCADSELASNFGVLLNHFVGEW